MKQAIAVLFLIATGMAQASKEPEVPRPVRNLEEVVVTGYHWNTDELRGKLMMGLGGAYLIHEYDKTRDEWRFVRASTEKTKDK